MKIRKVLVLVYLLIQAINVYPQQFPKLIMPGDYPDPTILRDGKDYYMTHSPFYYAPGFLIWHSQDLINWEPITRAMPDYQGSAMAPDLVKYKGRYYIYFPSGGTNWVIWSENIKGPWSKPIDLRIKGIDPGHVIGENGKRYLYVNDGKIVQLSDDGLAVVGEEKKMYGGWHYPKEWITECECLESPKLLFKDGYFYLTSAEGGTAGPATSHMAIVARSKTVFGPWENSPYNPLVHTYSDSDKWWSQGHGTIVDDINGSWWIVYHAYAKGYHTLGRQTLLAPIEWTADGWPKIKADGQSIGSQEVIKNGLKLSDEFDGPALRLQWMFWKENPSRLITIKQQILHVPAKGSSPADARLMLVTPTGKNYETSVKIESLNGNTSGLILFYDEEAFAGVSSDGMTFTIYKTPQQKSTVKNPFGKRFWLKIHNNGNLCTFLASKDGNTWITLSENVDVSQMHHNNFYGFYALRVALVSTRKGSGLFQHFIYRDGVPKEE